MKKLFKKLRSRRGISLTETLVTLGVLGILMATIVTAVGVSARIYRKSFLISEAQTLSSTLAQSLSGELRAAENIRPVNGVVVFDSASFGPGVHVLSASESVNGSGSADGVLRIGTAGRAFDLLGKGAYTGGLEAQAEVTYEDGVFGVTLTVTGPDPAMDDRVTEFSVRPILAD